MHTLLKQFIEFAEKRNITDAAFIVGGAVRDIFLRKELKDVDISLKGDAVNIGRDFAKTVGGSFVLLDEDFSVVRIVKDGQNIDLSHLRCNSIDIDLTERDITINAMALPLSTCCAEEHVLNEKLIDPYNGRGDLAGNIIRMVSEENFIKDPLRLLRVYRFAATLNFSIDEETQALVKDLAPLIHTVSGERISEELRHILLCDNSFNIIRAMADNALLFQILPENEINGALLLYGPVEDMLNNLNACFIGHIEAISKYFKTGHVKVCLKLSVFLSFPDAARSVAERLKMSRKEADFLQMIAANRAAVSMLHKEGHAPDSKESCVFLKKVRDDIYSLIILTIAASPEDADYCTALLDFYNSVFRERMALLPLVTGDDLIKEFGLGSSPAFKKILTAIDDMALAGSIKSRDDAFAAVREMIKKEL